MRPRRLSGTCCVSDRERIQEFCNMLVLLLCNFGQRSSAAAVSVAAQHARHTRLTTFLNTLTFNTAISRELWEYVVAEPTASLCPTTLPLCGCVANSECCADVGVKFEQRCDDVTARVVCFLFAFVFPFLFTVTRYLDFTIDLDEFAMASDLDKCLNVRQSHTAECLSWVVVFFFCVNYFQLLSCARLKWSSCFAGCVDVHELLLLLPGLNRYTPGDYCHRCRGMLFPGTPLTGTGLHAPLWFLNLQRGLSHDLTAFRVLCVCCRSLTRLRSAVKVSPWDWSSSHASWSF